MNLPTSSSSPSPEIPNPEYYVLWKRGIAEFQGNRRFVQQVPLFKTLGEQPDGVLAYSSLDRFDSIFRQLQKGKVSAHFEEFLRGYNINDYLRSFTIDQIADYFDCFTILIDFPALPILRLLTESYDERARWLYRLPRYRVRGIEIIEYR